MAKLPRHPLRPLPRPEAGRGEVYVLKSGTEIARVYFVGGSHGGTWNGFRSWGPVARSRFDHQEPPTHECPNKAVLYAGDRLTTAVAEVFQATRVVDVIADEPYLASLRLVREVRLLDMRSDWPTRAGASQKIGSGAYKSCHNWSRAIWEELTTIEGIAWDSSMHHGGTCYAFYERARDAFDKAPAANLPLTTRGLETPLANAADRLGYGLVLAGPAVFGSSPRMPRMGAGRILITRKR